MLDVPQSWPNCEPCCRHFHHMLFVLFDYGLNVKICVVAGLAQVGGNALASYCIAVAWLRDAVSTQLP